MLSELIYRVGEDDRGLARDDVGDSLLPEHGQVVLRGLFTHHTDEVIAVEIPASPPQLAERINGDGIGFRPPGNKDGPRPCRRVRGRDKWLIFCKVLLHRRATTNPSISVQLRPGCLILTLARDCAQS